MSVDPNNAILINGVWVDRNSEQAKQYLAGLNTQTTPQTTQPVSQQQTIIDNEASAGQGSMSDEQWEYVLQHTSKPLIATLGENNNGYTLNVETGDNAISYNDAKADYASRYGASAADNASVSEISQAMGKPIGVKVSKNDIEELSDMNMLSNGYTVTKAQLAGNGDIGYAYQKGNDTTTRLNNDLYSSSGLTDVDRFKLNLLVADQRIKDNTMINADLAGRANDTNRINLAGTSLNTDAYLIDNPYTHTESIINSRGGIYTGYTDVTGKIFGLKEPFPGANAITGLPYGTTIGGIDIDSLYKQTASPTSTSLPNIGLQSSPDNGDTLNNNKITTAGITENTSPMMLNNREYSDPFNAMGIFTTGQKIADLGSIPMKVAGGLSATIPGGNIAYALNYPVFAMQKAGAGMAGGLVMGAGAGIGLAEASIQDAITGNYTKYDNPTGIFGSNTLYVPNTLKEGFSGGILGNPTTIKGEDYTVGTTQRIDYVNENGDIVKSEYVPTTVKVPNEKTIDMPNLGEQLVMGFAPSLFDQKKGYLQVKENLGAQDVFMGVTEAGINTGLLLTGVKASVYKPAFEAGLDTRIPIVESTTSTTTILPKFEFNPTFFKGESAPGYALRVESPIKSSFQTETTIGPDTIAPSLNDPVDVSYKWIPKSELNKNMDYGGVVTNAEPMTIGEFTKSFTKSRVIDYLPNPAIESYFKPGSYGAWGRTDEIISMSGPTTEYNPLIGQLADTYLKSRNGINQILETTTETGDTTKRGGWTRSEIDWDTINTGEIPSSKTKTKIFDETTTIWDTIGKNKIETDGISIAKTGLAGFFAGPYYHTKPATANNPFTTPIPAPITSPIPAPIPTPNNRFITAPTSIFDTTTSTQDNTKTNIINDTFPIPGIRTSTRTTNKNSPITSFGGFDLPSGGGSYGFFGKRGKIGRAYINIMGNPFEFNDNKKHGKHRRKR